MNCTQCGVELSTAARFCPACGGAIAPTEPSSQSSLMRAASAAMIGREIAGRYRILEKLGEGGMGTVYRAEQMSLKRKIALKVLRPELSADPGLVRRFNAEAELAAKLNHPNTVTLFDFGQDADGSLFIAMELIDGQSLRDVLTTAGPIDSARALAVCEQVCASLADAHAVGIVHRDLKPDNVMLTVRGGERDVVRVLDFGIAKLRDERPDGSSVPMTQQGDLLGTPQYMAPEQIRAELVDGRADVYALGAMLYEMITGRLPFEGPTVMAILSKHLTEAPIPPAERRRDLGIPPQVNTLILDCMKKGAAARPATMELLRERLAHLRGLLGAPTPAGALRPVSMPVKRTHSRPPGVRGWTPSQGSTPMPGAPMQPATPTPPPPGPALPPAPTPASLHQTAPRASKAWIWVAAALLLVGGGIGAFIVLDGAGDSAPADGAVAAGGAAVSDDGYRSPISGDFTTHPKRDLYKVEGQVDDPAVDSRYVNPTFGYRIDLPDGFSAATDANNPALVKAPGMIRGTMAVIIGVALEIDPNLLGQEGMRAAAENIATGFGGTVVTVELKRIQGADLYAGIYDMTDGTRMEVVLYPASGYVLAVAFATPHGHFDGSASIRRDLFENRVKLR